MKRKILAVAVVACAVQASTAASASATPYVGFSSTSYWNTPLPANAPIASNSGKIIAYLKATNARNYVRLAGLGTTGAWGMPIYWASSTDPTYSIANSCSWAQPPELRSVSIPLGALPDPTKDAEMVVYNRGTGKVFQIWHASYTTTLPHWHGCGSVYYLGSNGLAGDVAGSDEPRNRGHLGIPPTITAVRLDEVRAGAINHVLWMHVHHVKCTYVWPLDGSQCGTSDVDAPPEGTRIRIKPSVDLTTLHLSPAALVVARALKKYGAIIGDQSGDSVVVKAENTLAEGRGLLWTGLLTTDSLSSIPLADFEVIRLGYSG
jgi:hypothetical protein